LNLAWDHAWRRFKPCPSSKKIQEINTKKKLKLVKKKLQNFKKSSKKSIKFDWFLIVGFV